MTRDERQQLVIKNWIATKGKGTCELPTGLYYLHQPFCKGIYRIIIGQYRGKVVKEIFKENPEINLEIKKSKSLYSVEGETYGN